MLQEKAKERKDDMRKELYVTFIKQGMSGKDAKKEVDDILGREEDNYWKL